MALKPTRNIVADDISYFMTAVATRGGIACMSTVGSGDAMDDGASVVQYAANPSGNLPVGILMNDVVNLDLTRQKLNPYKDEVQVNSKVTLTTIGEVVTDMLVPGITIAVNDAAYMGHSGLLTNADLNFNQTPIVGVFKSKKDEDGFVKVFVNLPMATPRL